MSKRRQRGPRTAKRYEVGPDLPGEEWKAVPGLESRYEVSSLGRVRNSVARQADRYAAPGHVLFQSMDTKGYPQVYLVREKGSRGVTTKVHRLVALAFIGPRREGMTVNHIDGVKANNALANLEYVTNAENIAHAARLGLMTGRPNQAGVGKKLSWPKVREIRRRVAAGERRDLVANEAGIHVMTVGEIVRGEIWKEVS